MFRLLLLLLGFLTFELSGQCPALVWSDEFDGETLDQSKWSFQTGDGCAFNICGWGNQELQSYTTGNHQVSEGTLKITARRENAGSANYTSTRIRTKDKYEFIYGRVEARMKMPAGQGFWPAFWLLPTDEAYGGWPRSGEIDVMESLGQEISTVHGTIHFGNSPTFKSSATSSFTLSEGNFTDEFHVFAMEWDLNSFRWYVDGYLYATKTRSDLGAFRWPFDQKFHFLLNLAVGGTWPGSPNSSTPFPSTFEIDYIRVYDQTRQPHLSGPQVVSYQAKGITYQIDNLRSDATIRWTIPPDAIQTDSTQSSITLDWNTSGGQVMAEVTDSCSTRSYSLIVTVEPPFQTDLILENFDDEASMQRTFQNGEFFDAVANPQPNDVNPSNLCGRYIRNSGTQFDVVVYDLNPIGNAGDFLAGDRRFSIDVYTDAPPGTLILLQLENKSRAQNEYPAGRHSRFQTYTTKQNEWERLFFDFLDQPDQFVGDFQTNQLVFLFASNTSDGSTYHFDNVEIYAKATVPNRSVNDDFEIVISPNPAAEFIELTIPPGFRMDYLEVVDRLGRNLGLNQSALKQRKIDISKLIPGVYYLIIHTPGHDPVTKTFIKQ